MARRKGTKFSIFGVKRCTFASRSEKEQCAQGKEKADKEKKQKKTNKKKVRPTYVSGISDKLKHILLNETKIISYQPLIIFYYAI